MAKPFKQLRDGLPTERKQKIEARTAELLGSLRLAEIRQARKLSQDELAVKLKVRQAAVSKVENRDDLRISTLRRHIEAMGGKLLIQAEFPEGRFQIDCSENLESEL